MAYQELNIPENELKVNATMFPSPNFILRYYLAEKEVEELNLITIDSSHTGCGIFLYEAGSYPAPKVARHIKYPVISVQVKYYDAIDDRDPRSVCEEVSNALDELINVRYGPFLIKRCFVEREFEFFEQQDTLLVYRASYYLQVIDLRKQAKANEEEYIPSEIEEKGLFLF
ncbi:hypothetical protein MHB65_19950 [Lysinibacillus sp. FSL K6-0075]|uniref:hypothetical protein n=1 Tax=Lysinibacillus sp. FSL K6-0075 TaxID=2921415 RepID=UPI003158DF1C